MDLATKLIEAGPMGIVIVLVLIFLYYMDKRDKIYTSSMEKITSSLDKLTQEQTQMRIDVKGHHESVKQMTDTVMDAVSKKKGDKSW